MSARDEDMMTPCIILFFTVIVIYFGIVFFSPNLLTIGGLANVSQILGFVLALTMSCFAIKGYHKLKIEIERIDKIEIDARGSVFHGTPRVNSPRDAGETDE